MNDAINLSDPDTVPDNALERRVWIKHRLVLAHTTFADLAREQGVSPPAISRTLAYPNFHLETVIAARLGLTPQKLFPERYDRDGNRLPMIRDQSRTTPPRVAERRKAGRR